MDYTVQVDDKCAFLSAVVECSSDAIYTETLDGTVTSWNPAAQVLFGYKPDEIIGGSMMLLVPTALAADEIEVLGRIRKGETIRHYETVRRRQNGSLVDVSITASPVCDASGVIVGVSKILRDITETKRAQEALRSTLESIGDGFFALDASWRFVYANAACEELFGMSRQALLGRSHWEVFAPTLGTVMEEIYRKAAAGQPGAFEFLYEPWNRWFSIRCFPREGGGISVSFHEITERKRAEDQKALLAAIVESSNDAIFTKTLDGIITSCNRAAEAMFGYTAEEVVGMPMTVLFPSDRVAEEEVLLAKMRAGETINHYETVRVRKNGSMFDALVTLSPIRDKNGRVIGISKTLRDISEHKRAEAEIQSGRAKLQAALESMADGIFISDIEGNAIQFNEAFARVHRFPSIAACLTAFNSYPSLFEGATPGGEAIPSDQWPLARALRGETGVGFEMAVRRKDTGESWIATYNFAPIRDEAGTITGAVTTLRDITETKRAQEALRESHERLEKVLDNQTVGAMFWDLNSGAMVDANETFLNLMGYSRSDVEERKLFWQTLTPPEYMEVSRAEIEKFLTTGRVGPYEKEYFCKDGSRKWLLFAGSSLGNNQCVEFCVDISARKKTEAALRESERQFRTLANAIPQLCWTAKADGWIDWYNDRWYEYTGTTPEQMEGWGWQSVHDPEVLPDVMARWQGSIATGQSFEMVFPIRGADGVLRPFLTRVMPVLDHDGNVSRWFGTNTDITEQRRVEEEIRSSRAILNAAMTSMNDAVFISDGNGKFVHFNDAFAEFHRFPDRESCLTALDEYPALFEALSLDGQAIPFDQWPISRALKGESAVGSEIIIRRKDTGAQWIASINCAPIRDHNGRVTGAVLTERDITEKKHAEEVLRFSEQRHRLLHESMRDGFVQTALDGRILELNEIFCQMVGYTADELRTMSYQDLTPVRWDPVDKAVLSEQVLTRGYSDVYEKEYRRKDGSVFPIELRIVLARDNHGRPESIWAIVRDISERKQYETRLQSMREELVHVGRLNELSQVSAGIAHELNQPLAAMLNYSNVAKRLIASGSPSKLEKASQSIARATEQAQRAGAIIRRMRGFIEKRESNRAVENINPIVEDAVALGLIGAAAEGISTELQLAPDLPAVLADRLQIQQVLVNLLRNAVEAMADVPVRQLTVATQAGDKGEVCVTVSDTGHGMTEEVAHHLFMPFFTTKRGGMGIGLVISRSIIESHGGSISVESGPGAGAKFRFTLPSAPPAG